MIAAQLHGREDLRIEEVEDPSPGPEVELTGSCGYSAEVFARVIELIDASAYPTDAWVKHVGLGEVTRVLEDPRAGRRMKVLVDLP